jgi:hypothetical protein
MQRNAVDGVFTERSKFFQFSGIQIESQLIFGANGNDVDALTQVFQARYDLRKYFNTRLL